jgi:hypothetical protein
MIHNISWDRQCLQDVLRFALQPIDSKLNLLVLIQILIFKHLITFLLLRQHFHFLYISYSVGGAAAAAESVGGSSDCAGSGSLASSVFNGSESGLFTVSVGSYYSAVFLVSSLTVGSEGG